jgi:hypothetical protein
MALRFGVKMTNYEYQIRGDCNLVEMEYWNNGKMEYWINGRMEYWKCKKERGRETVKGGDFGP